MPTTNANPDKAMNITAATGLVYYYYTFYTIITVDKKKCIHNSITGVMLLYSNII